MLSPGVGVGMVVSCSVLMLYSSTVLAWSVHYVLDCLKQGELPWKSCPTDIEGNATSCWDSETRELVVATAGVGAADNGGGTQQGNQGQQIYIPSDYYFL